MVLYNFKDACINFNDVVSITRSSMLLPVSGDNTECIVNTECFVISVFNKYYTTPITICFNDVDERDVSYDDVVNKWCKYLCNDCKE